MNRIAKSFSKTAAALALAVAFTATAQPHGARGTSRTLTPDAEQALIQTLAGPEGEFAAHALYSAILNKHGQIQPYASIRDAEARHIQALKRQFVKYGVTIPEDKYAGNVVAPATLLEAANQGVESEEKNIAVYDHYLSLVKQYPDLTKVFTNLQRASREAHLPAFKAAAKSSVKSDDAKNTCPGGHGKSCCQDDCRPSASRTDKPASK